MTLQLRSIKKLAVGLGCVVAIAAPAAQAQNVPDWQKAAGGKMAFDVASVRPDTGPFQPPSFAMSADDSFRPTGGSFHADFSLSTYIEFAYKQWLSREQEQAMLANLPKWVSTDRFLIEARAAGNPTKDQYRLMMQSLLADRFGLKLHIEKQEVPVYAMELIKPGRLGPKLIPHADGPACDVVPTPSAKGAPPNLEVFPYSCDTYGLTSMPNHEMLMGSRNTTMALMAASLPSLGALGRPVIDQTGLTGRYDFRVEFSREPAAPSGDSTAVAEPGTTFLEAAKEQLGIKLEATRAQMDVLVIDHVERPSEN